VIDVDPTDATTSVGACVRACWAAPDEHAATRKTGASSKDRYRSIGKLYLAGRSRPR
jgi:hypothetical protein